MFFVQTGIFCKGYQIKKNLAAFLIMKKEVLQGLYLTHLDRNLHQLSIILLQVQQPILLCSFLKLVLLLVFDLQDLCFIHHLVECQQDPLLQDLVDLLDFLQNLRQVMLFHRLAVFQSDFYFQIILIHFLRLQTILQTINQIFFYSSSLRHRKQSPFQLYEGKNLP